MDLHDLLENKAFEELNTDEQAFVLRQMSQEAYETERGVILASQAFFMVDEQEIIPDPIAPNKALFVLKQRKIKPPFGAMLLSYKVPAWQAVAVAVLVFFLTNGVNNVEEIEPSSLAVNVLRDTVFVDKYITKVQAPDTVVKVIYKALTGQTNKGDESPKVLASNRRSTANRQAPKSKSKVVSREFDDVLQYCSTSVSAPVSKDTFLQLLSAEVLF